MDNHNSQSHGTHAHDGHDGSHGSLKSYIIGFLLSIVLTIIPLVIVMNGLLSRSASTIVILLMAALQFVVQLFFFMHIRSEQKPRWNVMALMLGLFILLTILAGSIWIMTFNVVAH
jgi:cytochrome o ubiquinol oxidase subunit IV